MAATGIRLGSALNLDVEDFDFGAGEIVLRGSKGNRVERLPVAKVALQHLREFVVGRSTGPVFTNRTGERLSRRQVQRRFHFWMKAVFSGDSIDMK